MVLIPKFKGPRLSLLQVVQHILCLVSQLFEVGADWEVTIVELLRHTDLLQVVPVSAVRAKKGGSSEP